MNETNLSKECVDASVEDIDELCVSEYGIHLVELLNDADRDLASRRMRRLSGILLKRNFAEPQPIADRTTRTDAKRAWIWQPAKMENPDDPNSGEYRLLNSLREELPNISGRPPNWEELRFEAEHERGLFKVLALYLDDVIARREVKSFRQYFRAKESPPFKATIDLTNVVFNCAMAPVFASILPVPGLVVAISLIGIQFGYDSVFNAQEEKEELN